MYSDEHKQKADGKPLETVSAVRHEQTVELPHQRLNTNKQRQNLSYVKVSKYSCDITLVLKPEVKTTFTTADKW